jgi:hypothetical protein
MTLHNLFSFDSEFSLNVTLTPFAKGKTQGPIFIDGLQPSAFSVQILSFDTRFSSPL